MRQANLPSSVRRRSPSAPTGRRSNTSAVITKRNPPSPPRFTIACTRAGFTNFSTASPRRLVKPSAGEDQLAYRVSASLFDGTTGEIGTGLPISLILQNRRQSTLGQRKG